MSFYDRVIRRSQSSTVIDNDGFVASVSFYHLRKVQAVAGCMAFLWSIIALLYVVYHSRFVRRTSTQQYLFKLLLIHIIANTSSNFFMMLLGMVTIETENWRWCSFLGSMPGTLYISSHAFSNLIFLQRSNLVTKNINTSRAMDISLYIARICTYITLISVGGNYILLRGILLPNGVCTHTYPWWGSIVVLMVEFLLGTSFLIHFIGPLRKEAKFLSEHTATAQSSKRLMRIARRNFLWGSLSLCTTLVFMSIVMVARTILELSKSHNGAIYMLDWSLGPFETSANLLAALKLTQPVWKASSSSVVPRTKMTDSLVRSIKMLSRSYTNNNIRRSDNLAEFQS